MAETTKRLKKNISFSEHDRDIYDYLNKQGNASAFIKRLILQHMMMEQGILVPQAVKPVEVKTEETKVELEKKDVPCETQQPEETKVEESKVEETKDNKNFTVYTTFTPEDLENKSLVPDL